MILKYCIGRLKYKQRHENAQHVKLEGGAKFKNMITDLCQRTGSRREATLPLARVHLYARRARDYANTYAYLMPRSGPTALSFKEIEKMKNTVKTHRNIMEVESRTIFTDGINYIGSSSSSSGDYKPGEDTETVDHVDRINMDIATITANICEVNHPLRKRKNGGTNVANIGDKRPSEEVIDKRKQCHMCNQWYQRVNRHIEQVHKLRYNTSTDEWEKQLPQ